jgi:DNA-binding transcriptional regulator YiaG
MTTAEETETMNVVVQIPDTDGKIVETRTVTVPVTKDPETGELLLSSETIAIIESEKARYMGLLLPEEILELRERQGLTQRGISQLLQIGEKSYTRWETGRARPSRVINVLLRLLYDGRIDVEDLRSLNRHRFDWRKVVPCSQFRTSAEPMRIEPKRTYKKENLEGWNERSPLAA